MPRFYLHTNHPSQCVAQDDEGFDFPSIHAAKCEAVKFAGALLSDTGEHFWDTGDFELTVTDEKGLVMFAMWVVGIEAPAIWSADRRQT